jgi:hypothetical protein
LLADEFIIINILIPTPKINFFIFEPKHKAPFLLN